MKSTHLKHMSDVIFGALIKNFEPCEDSCLDHVSLKAEMGFHQITMYALADNDHELVIQDFGHDALGDWQQLDCTEQQFDKLKNVLSKEINRLVNNIEVEEAERLERIAEGKSIEDTEKLIDHNFHRSM